MAIKDLIRFRDVSLQFGAQPLLHRAGFVINDKERICLIGRNGAGKTSLLRLITGEYAPDDGEIERRAGLRIGCLDQELESASGTVREVIAAGVAAEQARVDDYVRLAERLQGDASRHQLGQAHLAVENGAGWSTGPLVDAVISRMSLPADRLMSELSGGWRRRVALGRALVARPGLLLLDEPNNHMDIATIEWLEQEVRDFPGSVLFVTHDRAFIQRVATRILEIDRGRLLSWPGEYKTYLRDKEAALAQEQARNATFDKTLAAEEAWIRQGIEARRTRNEGRVRRLQAMRAERAARRVAPGRARIRIAESDISGRRVIEARHAGYSLNGRQIIGDFSVMVMRGDRIGVIGNNGVGKTTLLRLMTGEIAPTSGTVETGTGLAVAWFGQQREELDPDKTVAETVAGGREFVTVGGQDRHVVSYMQDFLFAPARARTPLRALSGGEKNRVLLARIFAEPSNLLVMDEPTNDLDIEMLEILEARLTEYEGTLIVVSHDRDFLDAVVTSTLVFEHGGQIVEHMGGYSDWVRRGRTLACIDDEGSERSRAAVKTTSRPATRPRSAKLSYRERRELEQLTAEIHTLETRVETIEREIADSGFYAREPGYVRTRLSEYHEAQKALESSFERWCELEEKQQRPEST